MSKDRDPSQRIVITGMGCISPLGHDVESTWQRLANGEHGIVPIRDTILEGYPQLTTNVAATVKDFDLFQDPAFQEAYPKGERDLSRIHRSAQFALWSGAQALRQAGLIPEDSIVQEEIDPRRFGIVMGTDVGGAAVVGDVRTTIDSGSRIKGPDAILQILPERVASVASMAFQAKGPVVEVTAACATGNSSIIAAAEKLLLGKADIILGGSSSGSITPVAVAFFEGVRAVDSSDDPESASRPFDQKASGLVIGEGAAAFVMETLEHAQKRGAPVIAELVGFAETADAYQDTAPSGTGAVEALREALAMATVDEAEKFYINAHATSTRVGDVKEMEAIAEVFEPEQVAGISSSKGAIGHTVGAAGAIESVISIKAVENNVVPPSLKLTDPLPETEDWPMSPIKATAVESIDKAVNNSFGFGGLNAVTIYERLED